MNKKNELQNINANGIITIEDYCSRLYPQFEIIKGQFLLCFNDETNTVNFDKFMPRINDNLNLINNYICYHLFEGNKEQWNLSDTYEWVTKCFYKYKGKDGIKNGYIIQLFYKDKFQKDFCATCKKTLHNIISHKKQYMNANKRNSNNIIIYSIEGNDKVKELEDFKNYLDDIDDYLTYVRFAMTLNKKENAIVTAVISSVYKTNQTIDIEDLMKEINVKKRRFNAMIKELNLKWIEFNNKK